MSETLVFTRRSSKGSPARYTLTLAFEMRQKSRLHVKLDSGEEAFLKLDRGPVLRNGDCLETETGERVEVIAAKEELSVIRSQDLLALTRAAYHLGNRHVPLQVRTGELSYLHDRVLDIMVTSLGFQISHEQGPFEPESGAYGGAHANTPGHGLFRHPPHSHH
jgi:urease accessory protein